MNEATSSDGLNVKQPGLTQWLVGKSGEIPERDRLVVDAGGKAIGIYGLDGALYAYENICPHQGGPVCQGLIVSRVLELIDEKGVSRGNRFDDNELHVVCPWHGFEYDIRTGRHAARFLGRGSRPYRRSGSSLRGQGHRQELALRGTRRTFQPSPGPAMEWDY